MILQQRANCATMIPSLLFLQGTLIHTISHLPSASSTSHSRGGGKCVVYSLSHHPKKSCLLTAGSHGPVRVWKKAGWDAEEGDGEGDGDTEEGKKS